MCLNLLLSPPARSCGIPESVDNGDVSFASTSVGAKATYRCDEGFRLVGSKLRVCQLSRNWNPDVPTCKRIYMMSI